MRKSTLITTIAMIVVVVVALSTATYAWFSTSTTTKATQTITTTSDSGLTLSEGVITDTTITFNLASTAISLSSSLKGLYSPTGTIEAKCSDGTQSATFDGGKSAFAAGTALGAKARVTNAEAVAETSNPVQYKVPEVDPAIVNVSNGFATAQNVGLTILVNLKTPAANKDGVYYAASALTFYIDLTTGTGSSAAHKTITLGYSHCSVAEGIINAKNDKGPVATVNSTAIPANGVTGTRPDYANAKTDANIVAVTSAMLTSEVTAAVDNLVAGNKILVYNIPLAALNPSESFNLTMYSWVDGWIAKDHAKSADMDITYALTVGKYLIGPKGAAALDITFGS